MKAPGLINGKWLDQQISSNGLMFGKLRNAMKCFSFFVRKAVFISQKIAHIY